MLSVLLPVAMMLVSQAGCQTTPSPQPLPAPAGVEHIGLGYNVILGNPMGTKTFDGGIDPGIMTKSNILELSYYQGYTSDDGTYQRPDQVEYNIASSCSWQTTDYVFWGTESYQRNIVDDVVRIDGISHSTGKEFTINEIYDEVYNTAHVQGDVLYEERSRCDRGSARYQLENVEALKYPVTFDFAAAVCALPAVYNQTAYMEFLDTWGTDVIVEVNLGTKESDIYAKDESDFCFDAYESYSSTVSYGGSYNGYKDSVVVDMFSFENQVTSRFGSLIVNTVTGSNQLDLPISIRVISINETFDHDYWRHFEKYMNQSGCQPNDLTDLGVKENHVATALQEYAAWKNAPSPYNPSVQTPITWPTGTYGLPMTTDECPSSSGFSWNTGYRRHDTEDSNASNDWSDPYDLQGPVYEDDMDQNFCMKTTTQAKSYDWKWTSGHYCIFEKYSCPSGFSSGWIYWDDEDSGNINRYGGTLPDGEYDDNTKIYYCCRDDGSSSKLMYFPTDKPFALIKRTSACPNVYGMSVSHQWFYWDCEDAFSKSDKGGYHPLEDAGEDDDHRLHYCYYS